MDTQNFASCILYRGVLTSKRALRLWYQWHDSNDLTRTGVDPFLGGGKEREREVEREITIKRQTTTIAGETYLIRRAKAIITIKHKLIIANIKVDVNVKLINKPKQWAIRQLVIDAERADGQQRVVRFSWVKNVYQVNLVKAASSAAVESNRQS